MKSLSAVYTLKQNTVLSQVQNLRYIRYYYRYCYVDVYQIMKCPGEKVPGPLTFWFKENLCRKTFLNSSS